MSEQENKRSYKVLLPIPSSMMGAPSFANLGDFAGGNAESSVALALDKLAPDVAADLDLSAAVAVPTGNWNECEVEEDPRPRFKVRRRSEPQTQPEQARPAEGPAGGPAPIDRPGVA